MENSKRITVFILLIALLTGLCGCDNEFDEAREKIEENKIIRQEAEIQESKIQEPKIQISDIEVSNVEIDYLRSSSYSNYLHVVGVVKNKSNIQAKAITLTIYLYQNDSLILTEKDYIFDLGPYDENSFDFMVDSMKLFMCDKYIVKVTDVF